MNHHTDVYSTFINPLELRILDHVKKTYVAVIYRLRARASEIVLDTTLKPLFVLRDRDAIVKRLLTGIVMCLKEVLTAM